MFNQKLNKSNEPVFTQKETAEILGLAQSNISSAIKRGAMKTRDVGKKHPKIPASEIIGYARQTNRDVEEITEEIQSRKDVDLFPLFLYGLLGVGLYKLYEKLQE